MTKGAGYLVYFFSLIAAYMIYWLFSLLSSYSFISFLSFVAAVLHFGISSWLLFFLNKSGKVLSITTGSLLMIWPIQVSIHSIIDKEYSLLPYYLLPVLFTVITCVIMIQNLQHPVRSEKISKIIMAVIPSILFILYVCYVTKESISEGALNIVF